MAVTDQVAMVSSESRKHSFEITETSTGMSFPCAEDETILCAAQRAGVGLAYECSVGGCGSCKIALEAGDIDEYSVDAPGLKTRERAKGKRLACQAVPRSDCAIKFRADPAFEAAIRPRRFSAEFLGSSAVTHDIREFRFRGANPPAFLPGQYAMMYLPGFAHHRPYSMSNIANPKGEWHFMVRRVLEGAGTAYLFDSLSPGDDVTLDGPYSTAYLRTDLERDIVLIGGGSGLAPMVSLLRGVDAEPAMANRRVTFFFGGRRPRDMFNPDLLASLNVSCRLIPAVSEPEPEDGDTWLGKTGLIHDVARETLGDTAPAFEYYMAGPPPMIDAVRRMLVLDLKVPVDQLHYDRFF